MTVMMVVVSSRGLTRKLTGVVGCLVVGSVGSHGGTVVHAAGRAV
jgi:hypothetical protein